MTRLTDDDRHIGKHITYGNSGFKNYAFHYDTNHDEDKDAGPLTNAINICFHKYVVRITLPQFIKPLAVKVVAESWDEETVKRMGGNFYYVYFNKRYGFRYGENFLQVFYGVIGASDFQFPKELKEKSWSTFLPWMESRVVKHLIFDGDEKLVWQENFSQTEAAKQNNSTRYQKKQDCKKRVYLIRDCDGAEVKVRVHVEYMQWKRGTGWFKWMSLFVKDIKKRTIELEFETGVGNRKDSWKGGLIGVGSVILPGETVDQAVERFFKEKSVSDRDMKGMAFIRRIE